ncbi:hypothetical protein GN278_15590 [Rhodobacteraceae bacterium Araon29]
MADKLKGEVCGMLALAAMLFWHLGYGLAKWVELNVVEFGLIEVVLLSIFIATSSRYYRVFSDISKIISAKELSGIFVLSAITFLYTGYRMAMWANLVMFEFTFLDLMNLGISIFVFTRFSKSLRAN